MNQDFKTIVNLVRRVNPEAADILLSRADQFKETTASYLYELMCWEETPEGHDYWSNINYAIDNKNWAKEIFTDELTPIQRKCKKLWNNSNYVKQNPQRAY